MPKLREFPEKRQNRVSELFVFKTKSFSTEFLTHTIFISMTKRLACTILHGKGVIWCLHSFFCYIFLTISLTQFSQFYLFGGRKEMGQLILYGVTVQNGVSFTGMPFSLKFYVKLCRCFNTLFCFKSLMVTENLKKHFANRCIQGAHSRFKNKYTTHRFCWSRIRR